MQSAMLCCLKYTAGSFSSSKLFWMEKYKQFQVYASKKHKKKERVKVNEYPIFTRWSTIHCLELPFIVRYSLSRSKCTSPVCKAHPRPSFSTRLHHKVNQKVNPMSWLVKKFQQRKGQTVTFGRLLLSWSPSRRSAIECEAYPCPRTRALDGMTSESSFSSWSKSSGASIAWSPGSIPFTSSRVSGCSHTFCDPPISSLAIQDQCSSFRWKPNENFALALPLEAVAVSWHIQPQIVPCRTMDKNTSEFREVIMGEK